MLNRVVEPSVRAGWGSPRMVPGGLIVLETLGRKSGRVVRTPLAATKICGHVVVGTFRGARSQWVRNLLAQPSASYWLAGARRDAKAFVMHAEKRLRVPTSLPPVLRQVARFVSPYTRAGWAFAILAPPKGQSARRP